MKEDRQNMKADFNTDPRRQKALDLAMNGPIEVPPDRAVFFSGGRNMRQALDFCKGNPDEGFMTMLHTGVHQELMKIPLFGEGSPFTREEAVDLSALVSARFAMAASGNVLVFSNRPSGRSTLNTVEIPALLAANDDVTTINGTDKMLWTGAIRPPVLPLSDIVPPHLLRFDMHEILPGNTAESGKAPPESQALPGPAEQWRPGNF
ncbi:MAG: hypothetical protein KDI90_12325 [Alphaproteobacteria bacterium]|nr:hypothetical protein [Alphaproteobacteria bacterium]